MRLVVVFPGAQDLRPILSRWERAFGACGLLFRAGGGPMCEGLCKDSGP